MATASGYGILVGGNISGTAITINGVNAAGTTAGGGAVMLTAGLTATSGNINIMGTSTTGIGVSNLYGAAWDRGQRHVRPRWPRRRDHRDDDPARHLQGRGRWRRHASQEHHHAIKARVCGGLTL